MAWQSGRGKGRRPNWSSSWGEDWWEGWSWSWSDWSSAETGPRSREAKGRPRSRLPSVAVYFGTFDPIHENHIGLAKFALERELARLVYFVVNGDNPLKPLAASYEERLGLVQRRLEVEDDARIRCFHLAREETQRMRWSDRENICNKIRAEAAAKLQNGQLQVVQMVGQDSFEQAVGRSSDAKASRKGRGKGIFATGIHFLVFPRGHGGAHVQIPRHMKDRVEIAKDYVDPVLLSSTDVRALACTSEGLSGRVHPALQQQVMDIYTRPRQFFLLFLGPPGSGKTTLGRELEAALGFYHLSGGEAYRAAKARAAASTRPEAQQQTVAKVFAALALAAARLKPAPVSFDGFLPKDLPDFEEKVGQIGLIVKLQCSSEVLRQRIGDRGSRPHDVPIDADKRVASHEQRSTREDASLAGLEDSAGIVCELDADAPLHEVLEAVQGLVLQAADEHQIKLPEVVHEQGSRVLIDDEFWNQIFQEIESSPAQAYNLRRNATSMRARQGSRNLKNFNNLVKDILIQWGVREVSSHLKGAGQDRVISALDVASGRGGDQLKFVKASRSQGCRLCYTAIDVAEAQVQEATNRLRQGLERQKMLKPTLLAARFFVGDVAQVAPQQLGMPTEAEPQWFHVASIQFALHYAFSSRETAQSFLRHAAGNVCSGGLLLITTVDASQMARIAAQAQDLVYESELLRVTFPDADIHSEIQKGIAKYGLRYRFDLAGEGIDCEEFVVPEELLTDLLNQIDIEIIAGIPFSELSDPKGSNNSREVAKWILQRLGESVEDIADAFRVYDNLGLKLTAPEQRTVSLYKLYVGRKRPRPSEASCCPGPEEVARSTAQAVSNRSFMEVLDLRSHK